MKKLIFISLFLIFPFFNLQAQEPIRVLIVPGHDDQSWGAEWKGVKEADMTLGLAKNLYDILSQDEKFRVWIARDKSVGYTDTFNDYFASQWNNISLFRENAIKVTQSWVDAGIFSVINGVPHNNAAQDVAIKLYGINKWANENDMDAVIHIHFNDNPDRRASKAGKYKGYTVYIPERQLPNARATAMLGFEVWKSLYSKYDTSTYEKEAGGFAPDQKLIVLGSNMTLNPSVRSVLVEYGYIYEKIFSTYALRQKAYKDMAELTAQGIKNYFSEYEY